MKHLKSYNQLFEVRQQLEIPFDGKHPLHDKPTHVHIIEALEELDSQNDVNVEDYKSDWNASDINSAWVKYTDDAFEEFKSNDDESNNYYINSYLLNEYPPFDYPNLYTKDLLDYIEENDITDVYDLNDDFYFDSGGDIRDYLTDEASEEVEYAIKYIFEEFIDEYDCLGVLQHEITDNGLVPIYRAINYSKEDEKDTYLNILNRGNVGVFWSFEKEGAIDHNGGNGDTFVLCAFIKPEYIDWTQTIFKSAYSLRVEKEIETLEGIDVMIYSIIDEKTGKELKQDKAFIVKT